MTDMSLPSTLPRRRRPGTTAPNATWGFSLAAAALALLIGLSAADINRRPAIGAAPAQTVLQDGAALDGRGKWGGYLP